MRQLNIKNLNSISEDKLFPYQRAILEHMRKGGSIKITVNTKSIK